MPTKKPPPEHATAPDPCPTLPIEKGPEGKGVGRWVWEDKHRLLAEYLWATRNAWPDWPRRIFIDPFCSTGRIQAVGEGFTRPGGAVRAWLSLEKNAPFTGMFVGDKEPERAAACVTRLQAIGARAKAFPGLADDTVPQMVRLVPRGALCMAYVDPYNLELLSFSILEQLARLPKVDLAVNFSTMDLQRNAEFEFDPSRARFDGTAPGWREDSEVCAASKRNVPLAFFNYWFNLVTGLGFEHSQEMPLVRNNEGRPIYRMVFFARHPLPKRIWGDVARGPNLELFS